jgi:Ca-activated chloride channel family protein
MKALRRPLLVLLLTVAPLMFSGAQRQGLPAGGAALPNDSERLRPQKTDDFQSAPTFTVDVNLVNVFVTVLDENNAPVAGLKKDDFKVFEDNNLQDIAVFERESQLPLSIVLAIDTSLSTHKDLGLELDSAKRFAHSILRPVDLISVFEFSEVVNEAVPFTANLPTIDRGIRSIRAGSATAMYDAIFLAAGALRDQRGRKVLVIITDGGDTVSKVSYQEALRAAQQAEATVYSVIIVPIQASAGRDIGGEHALIQLSHDTGGRYYYAASIANLDRAFEQISEELRTQYRLAYYPNRRIADSDFRRIEVRAHAANSNHELRTRHRTGYYTSKFE